MKSVDLHFSYKAKDTLYMVEPLNLKSGHLVESGHLVKSGHSGAIEVSCIISPLKSGHLSLSFYVGSKSVRIWGFHCTPNALGDPKQEDCET